MIARVLWSLVIAIAVGGCATSFTGDAHIEGPPACQKKCASWGLDFAGMVAMGEYSDACICHVHGQQASGSKDSDDAAAVAGSAAGVVMQMRRAQQQSADATLH